MLEIKRKVLQKFLNYGQVSKAATRVDLLRKVFLKISQYSQENTCARVSIFNKVAGLRPCNLNKKETLAQVFPVNIAKYCEFCEIFKNTFLQNTSERLLRKF